GILAGSDRPVEKPYSITLGLPLSHYPVIHTALNILGLARRRIEIPVLSNVLRSPFDGGANVELDARSCFDAMLRERGEPDLTLKTMLRIAEGKKLKLHQQCKQFVERLKAFNVLFLSSAKSCTPGQWAITFSELLKQFGWPGDRILTSDEFQTIEALGLYVAVAQVLAYVYQLRTSRIHRDVNRPEPPADLPIPDDMRYD
ncbi:MAG: hypothetical protein R3318_04170, partial [Gammaproteobacteria bacterium]|nr:hypothetical protein [Gammaproteobacteria bacterium]